MTSNRMDPADAPESTDEHVSPADAVREAIGKLAELRAYAEQYFSARVDRVKLTARKIAVFAALGVVGLFLVSAAMVIALVQLLYGLAGVIAAGLGGRMWAGELIIGGGLLILAAGAGAIGIVVLRQMSMKATVKKYERKQREQRQRFGRSSRDRTAAAGKVEL